MPSLIKHSHDKEERPCAETVIDHLGNTTLDTLDIKGKDSQHDKTQMAHAGIGNEFLKVVLHHGDQRAINYTHNSHPGNYRDKGMTRFREQRQTESHKTIRPHFQKNTCQDYNSRCRRFYVSIRQPCMKRKHWHLDGKGKGKGEEQPELDGKREVESIKFQQIKRIFTRCPVI